MSIVFLSTISTNSLAISIYYVSEGNVKSGVVCICKKCQYNLSLEKWLESSMLGSFHSKCMLFFRTSENASKSGQYRIHWEKQVADIGQTFLRFWQIHVPEESSSLSMLQSEQPYFNFSAILWIFCGLGLVGSEQQNSSRELPVSIALWPCLYTYLNFCYLCTPNECNENIFQR